MQFRILVLLSALFLFSLRPSLNSSVIPSLGPYREGNVFYAYSLRGEVRLLFLWLGRSNVGGGYIAFDRRGTSPASWNEEIEVLFGSDPERIPKRINRWGYGREISQWIKEPDIPSPRLAATEFQGIMRHSAESSLDEALDTTSQANASGQFLYDTTLSKVMPAASMYEYRMLVEKEEFDYRYPENLVGKFREALTHTPPKKSRQLVNSSNLYGAPYGFLTGLSQLIQQVLETGSKTSLTYVYNSKLYTLSALSVDSIKESRLRSDWKAEGVQQVRRIRFRTVSRSKNEETDFELWVPGSGLLKGIPVRILHQPRWWLRLQLDLELSRCRSGDSPLLWR